jgi:proteic killer suppression protein
MEIESIRHKALRAFAETGKSKGLPANLADRLLKMVAWLNFIDSAEKLLTPPNFGAHLLTGNRAGTWSLTVSRNWRMTFKINEANAIADLDLEDYH